MRNCKACSHWAVFDHDDGWGICSLAPEKDEWGDELFRAMGRDEGEGWLQTRSDFGCVMWQVDGVDFSKSHFGEPKECLVVITGGSDLDT